MAFLSLALAVLTAGGDGQGCRDAGATVEDVRAAVTRSLPFLEDEGMAWMETRKCASCHHVPMMLRTHREARRRGFAVDDEALAEAQAWALGQYLGHAEHMPTGQDKGFPKKGPGPGAVYLALSLDAAENSEALDALSKLAAYFAGKQEVNGSWALKISSPPVVDGDDVATMFITLAMDRAKHEPALEDARRQAVRWLQDVVPRPETQPIALRLVVAAKFDLLKVQPLVTRLLGRQNDDGGWSQIDSRPSDALATGQALYALLSAGVPADSPSIRRALVYLLRSQHEDGSWFVKTRNPNSHDVVISYYGTGWATLGLLQSLPSK
jgi:hypothetical protein